MQKQTDNQRVTIGKGIFHSASSGYDAWFSAKTKGKLKGAFVNFQNFARWYRDAEWNGDFNQGCVMCVTGWLVDTCNGMLSPRTATIAPRTVARMMAMGNEAGAVRHIEKLAMDGKISAVMEERLLWLIEK